MSNELPRILAYYDCDWNNIAGIKWFVTKPISCKAMNIDIYSTLAVNKQYNLDTDTYPSVYII